MEGSGVLGKEVCHQYVHPPLPVLLIFLGIKLVLSQKLHLYIDFFFSFLPIFLPFLPQFWLKNYNWWAGGSTYQ